MWPKDRFFSFYLLLAICVMDWEKQNDPNYDNSYHGVSRHLVYICIGMIIKWDY